jgi:hypothetical protein
MKKITLTPANETQLQHWIEKLKSAGAEYDVVTENGKAVLKLSEEAARSILGVDPKIEKQNSRIATVIVIVLMIFGISFCSRMCSTPEPEVMVDATKLFYNSVENMVSQFGEPDSSEEHNDKYPCKDRDCLKQSYAGGMYEVYVYNGMVVYMTITPDRDIPTYDNAIVAIGWPEKVSDLVTADVTRWNYDKYQISAFDGKPNVVGYFMIIPAELAQ